MSEAGVFVLEAGLRLDSETDPASVGAAVTTELCGHWKHEGPCHWPHKSAIDTGPEPALFRTVFVADPGDEPAVRKRIERSLQYGGGWHVQWMRRRGLLGHEQALAARLAAGPRASEPLPRPD